LCKQSEKDSKIKATVEHCPAQVKTKLYSRKGKAKEKERAQSRNAVRDQKYAPTETQSSIPQQQQGF